MVIGFNSTSYIAVETDQQATVCVDVLNPPSGGALRPFVVALLPHKGQHSFVTVYTSHQKASDTFKLTLVHVAEKISITVTILPQLSVY